MTSFEWFYEEPFHSIFLLSTTTISLLSNGLLLFVIFTTSSASIGYYRYLLAVFAVSDLLTSFAHPALLPAVHMTNNGAYAFSRRQAFGESFDNIFILLFTTTFYQTFIILAYHYVYRFNAFTSGINRSFTEHWSLSRWAVLALIVNFIYMGGIITTYAIAFLPTEETRALVPPEIMKLYGVNLKNPNKGFIVIAMKRPDSLSGALVWVSITVSGIFVLCGAFGSTACVIAYCIWRILAVIRCAGNHLTVKTRAMQMQLFRALLMQTLVPVLLSYLPLSIIILFPAVTGIPLGAFGNVLIAITSIFPSIDAFFVLFFIGRFRVAVIRLLRLPGNTSRVSSDQRPTDR